MQTKKLKKTQRSERRKPGKPKEMNRVARRLAVFVQSRESHYLEPTGGELAKGYRAFLCDADKLDLTRELALVRAYVRLLTEKNNEALLIAELLMEDDSDSEKRFEIIKDEVTRLRKTSAPINDSLRTLDRLIRTSTAREKSTGVISVERARLYLEIILDRYYSAVAAVIPDREVVKAIADQFLTSMGSDAEHLKLVLDDAEKKCEKR